MMTSEEAPRALEVSIPDEFFTEILPRIGDLGELKIVLHLFYLGAAHESPAVPAEELMAPRIARSVVGDSAPVPAPERLRAAVDRAIANGAVLRLTLDAPTGK